MNDERKKTRQLGRGLSALFGEERDDYAELDAVRQWKTVPVEFLRPNRYQPRRDFDADQIDSLVASIRQQGILQPILVRRDADDANAYEIVAGERRWRAAQLAQLHEVPVVIREMSDQEALEVALVENIQRQDLNPLEEALGFRRLMDDFSHTQEDLSRAVGKSRSHIANTLRLMKLPDGVKTMLTNGDLTAGHARALLNSSDPAALARRVIRRGLNVRQTERMVKREKAPLAASAPGRGKDIDTIALEDDLSRLLGLRVTVNFRGDGGDLVIHYDTLDQLDDVLRRLKSESVGGRQPM